MGVISHAATEARTPQAAQPTDETLTEAIVRALESQHPRTAPARRRKALVDHEKLAEVLAYFRSRINEHLTDHEIIGYDDVEIIVVDSSVIVAILKDETGGPTGIRDTAAGRPMAVIIEDEETDRLVRQLAERAGEPIDVAVRKAVLDRLQRIPLSEEEIARRKRKLAELHAYLDSLPRINEHLTEDELVGYDENGLPI